MQELKLEVLADDFVFLEGPRWHQGRLWLSDMWGHTVYALDTSGQREAIATVPNRPSGLAFLPDGRRIVVSMADRKLMEIRADGSLAEFVDLSGRVPADINDCVTDASGAIYVGNFGYDLIGGAEAVPATLLRVTPDGKVSEAADGLSFPNGTVITPDGGTLICAETFGSCLTAFDRAADGSLGKRRQWAALGERTPDGICLDAAGAVWVASFLTDEFVRVTEGGAITHRVPCAGRRAVACNLGGADGRTLFALTFEGHIEDMGEGKDMARLARVEVCQVEVGASGSP